MEIRFILALSMFLLNPQPSQDLEAALREDVHLAEEQCSHLLFYNCTCYVKKWRETRIASDPEIVSDLGEAHFAESYKSAVREALRVKPGLFDACVAPAKVASYGRDACSREMGSSGPAANSVCKCTVAAFTRMYMSRPNPDYAENTFERAFKSCIRAR
jgi:hypothetical protein